MKPSPFRLGGRYLTADYRYVVMVKIHNEGTPWETYEDSEGCNRYSRIGEYGFGRVTGSCHKFTCPGNIHPIWIRVLTEEVERGCP